MNLLTKLQGFAMQSLKVLDNKYVSGMVKVFLVLYASLVAPKLPAGLVKLFQNPAFKVLVLFLIVYVGMKDPTVALLVAVGFTVSMVTLNKLETVKDLGGLLDTVVDSPQKVANELVDGAQDLVRDVSGVVKQVSGPLLPVVSSAEDLVHGALDMGQDVANTLVDTVQDAVGMFHDGPAPAEEHETNNVDGYNGNSNGAPLY